MEFSGKVILKQTILESILLQGFYIKYVKNVLQFIKTLLWSLWDVVFH